MDSVSHLFSDPTNPLKNVPEGTLERTVIVYNHGFAENVNLYREFLPFLAAAGHRVIIFDQRGAGETSPGDLYALTNQTLIHKDLDTLLATVFDTLPTGRPLILAGHSMGGGIVLDYAACGTHRARISAFWCLAPLVHTAPEASPGVLVECVLLPLLAYVAPTLRRPPGLSTVRITHNSHWMNLFRNGPDLGTRVVCSAAQMNDMLWRGRRLLDPQFVRGIPAGKPIALFQGVHDEINSYQATRQFWELITENSDENRKVELERRTVESRKRADGSEARASLYSYADMDHCMVHETPDRQELLLADLVSFLESVSNY